LPNSTRPRVQLSNLVFILSREFGL